MIYHYDVIEPDTLPTKFNMKLIHHLQTNVAPNIFTPPGVYDGRKNFFVPRQLAFGNTNSREFNVPSPDADSGDNKRPPKVYKVRLTKVNEINTVLLQRFVNQQQSQDENVLTAIMALNVVIRMEPNQKYPFNVRSFFTSRGKKAVGGGLELWRGYFQSIRPTIGKIIVNVDISTGMMFKAGPLIDLCLDFLGKPGGDASILSPARGMPDRERIRLQKFVLGVKVQIKSNRPGSQRVRIIRGLSKVGADVLEFEHEGRRISVANYFRTKLNLPLRYPSVLCVEVGKGAMYPLELCTVPEGQISRRQVPPNVTKEMVTFATMKPEERFRNIEEGARLLAYGQSEYVRQFGLAIHTENGLLNIPARVLQPPKLQYGQGSRDRVAAPRNGSWNMVDKRFYQPITIKQWILVCYERQNRFPLDRLQQLVKDFISACKTVGITVVENNPLIKYEQGQGKIGNQLKNAGLECRTTKGVVPNLILIILPENGDDIYRAVKHFGDVTMGVATQCMKSNKLFRANLQYWANVLLKVNVKLGGINLIPDQGSAALLTDPRNPTIVMGADVMHAAPGARNIPSYASLVANVDSNTSKYIAVTKVQTSRREIIEDLEEMCKTALEKYMSYRRGVEKAQNAAPQRIIFYRDGVSEGQFKEVLARELDMIKKACTSLKISPKITLTVVGKRHHIRFKPGREDEDKSGNCPAGTIVDKEIGHPTEFDWYLQSHGGLLGTSRPSHYTVLHDDNKFSSDALQALSFALCHVYARSTRSVSIPAPVYYADIVCSRAKYHYDPDSNLNLSDTATQLSESDTLESFRREYKPLNPNQANMMYFM
ncbi:hypothetical protein AMATHDRAFT_187505 [Amanita thiersii Skay4041]|uniref:Piwi domain-containing protein n=1 Tax=Amanita thiersii Skay4041 TaxID=703135 RepID=A0A2A9NYF0_9AGAR|nr:hypothetical protein AMATHDRAFT_187505 [Amanita thiersii Skay4041]